jgi:hypothetical protein
MISRQNELLGIPPSSSGSYRGRHAAGGVIQPFDLGGIVGGIKDKASSAWDWFASSEHDANAQFAYELWRGKKQFTPQWRGHRDRELWDWWIANAADKKYRDVKYRGRNRIVGSGSSNTWKAWSEAFGLTSAAKVITHRAGGGVIPGMAAGGVAGSAMAESQYLAPVPHPGLLKIGNIDLDGRKRPLVHNKDGSDSSVLSTSYGFTRAQLAAMGIRIPARNGEVLIPETIQNANGRWINASGPVALDHFRATHQHLGIFKNATTADIYGTALHNYLAKFTESIHRATGGVTPRFMADGGIVTKPTLAMIGERGNEAVIPLSRGNAAIPIADLVPLNRLVANNTSETNNLLRGLPAAIAGAVRNDKRTEGYPDNAQGTWRSASKSARVTRSGS